ncbi:uncharacterized protein LOC123447619 [Hordeum vulgare subsp. vulgare]|uniref:Uncharacterized protein n=1 Tax=Hordeum vulgare subsp. vulgare TaxID=112509 RepID=A0A8I6WYF0_HORVV|nr:uncharacterized protein LOC123447619 [Hordeum vulgare subsp. vulgare]
MCRAPVDDLGRLAPRPRTRRLDVRAFYLRLSSSSPTSTPPAELTLLYRPAIGGAALELAGRALPPASPAEVALARVRGAKDDDAPAYASADRVSAAEGARFEVYDGKELAAEGAFFFARGLDGWRVECRRPAASRSRVAEVLVLAKGGALIRARARAARRAGLGCSATPLEGIPEEGPCGCQCGACGDDDWEMVGDSSDDDADADAGHGLKEEEEVDADSMRWALEMGAWAVCVGVGLLATARRFSRSRRRAALR